MLKHEVIYSISTSLRLEEHSVYIHFTIAASINKYKVHTIIRKYRYPFKVKLKSLKLKTDYSVTLV